MSIQLASEENVPTSFNIDQDCIDRGGDLPWNCMTCLAIEKSGGKAPIVYKIGAATFIWNGRKVVGTSKTIVKKIKDFIEKKELTPFCIQLENIEFFDLYDNEGISWIF